MRTNELDRTLEFSLLTLILFKLSEGTMHYVWGVFCGIFIAVFAIDKAVTLFRWIKKGKE